MAVRAFVEPSKGTTGLRTTRPRDPVARGPVVSSSLVQFFTPSYSLYPVLADIHGAAENAVPLSADFTLPSLHDLKHGPAMGLPGGPDLGHHAERAQRPRLPHRAVGGPLPRSERRRAAGRGLRGFRRRKRHEPRAEIPARARRADLLEGLFALLPARRLLRRPPGTHRRAPQDPRQLQRQRPGPNRGAAPRWTTCLATGPTSGRSSPPATISAAELGALGFQVFPSQTNFILVRPPNSPPKPGCRNCATAESWCGGSVTQPSAITCASPSARRGRRSTGQSRQGNSVARQARSRCSHRPQFLCCLNKCRFGVSPRHRGYSSAYGVFTP